MDVTNCKLYKSSKHNLNVVHACLVWVTFQYYSYAKIVVTVLRVMRCGMLLGIFCVLYEIWGKDFQKCYPKEVSVLLFVLSPSFLAKIIACLVQPCTAIAVILSQDP